MLKPNFNLEIFEGPLDLLLHLIQKNKVNIEDIPIAEITRQYIEYIEAMSQFDLEITSEFLTMAVHLLHIKSKMLLPKHDEEEQDPRAELAERLMEYRKVKEAAEILKEAQFKSSNIFFKEPESIGKAKPINISLPIDTLLKAFSVVLERNLEKAPPPRSHFKGIVEREEVSIEEMVDFVLDKITNGKISFESIFFGITSRPRLVATFLAVLHLISRSKITFFEQDNKVYLKKSGDN